MSFFIFAISAYDIFRLFLKSYLFLCLKGDNILFKTGACISSFWISITWNKMTLYIKSINIHKLVANYTECHETYTLICNTCYVVSITYRLHFFLFVSCISVIVKQRHVQALHSNVAFYDCFSWKQIRYLYYFKNWVLFYFSQSIS